MDAKEKRIDAYTKFSQVIFAKEELTKAQIEYERARDEFLKVMDKAFPMPIPPNQTS